MAIYKEKGLKMYSNLIKELKKVCKTQSMKVVLSKLGTEKNLSEFKKLSIEDMNDLISESSLEVDSKSVLFKILNKIERDEKNKDNENYNPCVGAETFSGAINFNFATGFLIKAVDNAPNCFKMTITMENGTEWFKYGTKEHLENLASKVRELKGWF